MNYVPKNCVPPRSEFLYIFLLVCLLWMQIFLSVFHSESTFFR